MKGWYGKAKRDFLKGDMDYLVDAFHPVLVTASYTPNKNVDEFMSDIGGALVTGGLGDALASKAVSDAGVISAAIGYVSAVPAGQAPRLIVIVQYTGDPATSRLLCWNNEGIPLPIETDGTDVHLRWPTAGIGEI